MRLVLKTETTEYWFATPTTFLEKAFREWTFVAITYNPTSTKKVFGAVNTQYIDQFVIKTIETQITEDKFKFNPNPGDEVMLDDIVFFPKYSTERELSAIYNSSK